MKNVTVPALFVVALLASAASAEPLARRLEESNEHHAVVQMDVTSSEEGGNEGGDEDGDVGGEINDMVHIFESTTHEELGENAADHTSELANSHRLKVFDNGGRRQRLWDVGGVCQHRDTKIGDVPVREVKCDGQLPPEAKCQNIRSGKVKHLCSGIMSNIVFQATKRDGDPSLLQDLENIKCFPPPNNYEQLIWRGIIDYETGETACMFKVMVTSVIGDADATEDAHDSV
mmetsp:Transcript_19967/g.57839  ORF Transcript_19967/g.57839 Transcript_19967/m.57839 type:complete len:231 (-) Transcript_19967:80-772(-)